MQGYGTCEGCGSIQPESNPLIPSDEKPRHSHVTEVRPQPVGKLDTLAKSVSDTARRRFQFWKERIKLLLKSPWFYFALSIVATFAFAGWYFGNVVFLQTVLFWSIELCSLCNERTTDS